MANEYLLVMQYANGGDLRNYLANNFKNLNWDDKKKLAFQIADRLNYLHNENILHRDLVSIVYLFIYLWRSEQLYVPTVSL